MLHNPHKNQDGFTLIEIAIVIVIMGVLFSILGSALVSYIQKSKIDKTEQRMEVIKESLTQFFSINRRYPCIARMDLAPTDPNFGVEDDAENCAENPSIPNAIRNASVTRMGSVPTRTLNIPDEYAIDGWGRRFTYIISKESADTDGGVSSFVNAGGTISVRDSTGNAFMGPQAPGAGTPGAHYALISHGETGEGAFSLDGIEITPCNSGALDNTNCETPNDIMSTLINSTATGANFFDDYVYYQGQTAPDNFIPVGAVMAFNLTTCPDGWAAFGEAEGRFIIGSSATPVPATSYDYTTLSPTATAAVNIDDVGNDFDDKDDSIMMPPYVALLYCERR